MTALAWIWGAAGIGIGLIGTVIGFRSHEVMSREKDRAIAAEDRAAALEDLAHTGVADEAAEYLRSQP